MGRYPIKFDIDEKKEEESEGQNNPLVFAGVAVALLVVAVALYMMTGRGGSGGKPNVVGQDELATFLEAHPELRNDSGRSN